MSKREYVYIGISEDTIEKHLFKIGMTRGRVDVRENQIKNMNPSFVVFHEFVSSDARKLEKQLHNRFFEKRVVGEWFYFTPQEMADLMNEFDKLDYTASDVVNIVYWKLGYTKNLDI